MQTYKNVIKVRVFSKCAWRELNSRPRGQKECAHFACPSNPPAIPAAFQNVTFVKIKSAKFKSIYNYCKFGLNLLTPAVYNELLDMHV
jgi:hypothetical protein